MGTYSKNGKTEQRSGHRSGKQGKTSTVTEDQHGMTQEASATETREVSHPSRTPGNNSVLSGPTRTLESKQLDGPLRSQSKSTKCNSKKISGPLRSPKAQSEPDRHTLLILKVIYRAGMTPQRSSSLTTKANYQTANQLPFIINQVQLSLMVQKSFELSTPIHLIG